MITQSIEFLGSQREKSILLPCNQVYLKHTQIDISYKFLVISALLVQKLFTIPRSQQKPLLLSVSVPQIFHMCLTDKSGQASGVQICCDICNSLSILHTSLITCCQTGYKEKKTKQNPTGKHTRTHKHTLPCCSQFRVLGCKQKTHDAHTL